MKKLLIPSLLAASALIGTSQAALWTPAETTTALWLDAADASTIGATGNDVNQWDDKSGNGRNATGGAGTEPDTGGIHNGLNVINLDGTAEFFSLGTGLDWMGDAGKGTHTAFVMLNVTQYGNIYGAAIQGGGNGNKLHVGFRNASDYRMNHWANDWYAPITANFVADEFNFLRYNWIEGDTKTIYANAAFEGSSTSPVPGDIGTMAGGGSIGNVVAQGLLGADLAEFIIVEGTPDAATTDRIEGYLAWKWGEQAKLPGGHAYANEAPQSLIPEPSSVALFGLGGLALILRRRR